MPQECWFTIGYQVDQRIQRYQADVLRCFESARGVSVQTHLAGKIIQK